MSAVDGYLRDVKRRLLLSPVIIAVRITTERALADRGYFRARLTLVNGDFLEISEYVIVQAGTCVTQEYRHQYHIHHECDTEVRPGTAMSILDLITFLETEFRLFRE